MTAPTRDDFSQFCGNLRYRLQLLATTRVHTDRLLASRFNVFQFIRPHENLLSDMIAELLDPAGRHGQGSVFLQEFVRQICPAAPSVWEFRSIRRENATSLIDKHRRRLDVLVDLGAFGIAIENKPWAGEQDQQIHDYVAHLKRRFAGNFMVVYLSAEGTLPESIDPGSGKQLVHEGKLILCAYAGRFRDWLTRCHQLCAAEKIRWFLSDFLAYVEQTFPAGSPALNPSDDE